MVTVIPSGRAEGWLVIFPVCLRAPLQGEAGIYIMFHGAVGTLVHKGVSTFLFLQSPKPVRITAELTIFHGQWLEQYLISNCCKGNMNFEIMS